MIHTVPTQCITLPYDSYDSYDSCCCRGRQDTAIAIDDTEEEEDDGLAGQGPSAGPHSVTAVDAPGPKLPACVAASAAAATAAAAATGDGEKLAGAGTESEAAERSGGGAEEADDGDVQIVEGGPDMRRSARLREVAALEVDGEEGGAAKPVKDSELFKVSRWTFGCEG